MSAQLGRDVAENDRPLSAASSRRPRSAVLIVGADRESFIALANSLLHRSQLGSKRDNGASGQASWLSSVINLVNTSMQLD